MSNVCLPPKIVDAFKQALVAGKIVPERLANMTSEERHELFSKVVGEGNAKATNTLFESKLLLKNQQRGFISWASKLTNVSPAVKRDLLTRIGKLDHILSPQEEKGFLKDLASTKLGVDVSSTEAKQISVLSSNLKTAAEAKATDGTFKTLNQRMTYGRAHYDLANYVQDLKDRAAKQPVSSLLSHPVQAIGKVANLSRSFKTVGDLSIAFRNGFKMMTTHPTIWAKSFKAAVNGMVKTLGSKDAWREFQAYARSDPNYDELVKANLLPKSEEAYPASIPEKIPLFGKVAKSTQVGYEIMSQMMRVDSYGKLLKGAEKAGVDITDANFRKSLGKFVGALTNRGSIGKLEPAGNAINAFLFSPRALASTLHLATDWARKDYDPFVRKQALKAVMTTGATIAGTMAIANALAPGSVELDPRSSNFGKVKLGDTTFDISGGMSSLATLGARLYTGTSKSSTTGAISSLTSGAYGSSTRMDEVVNFFSNKAAPAVATLIAQLKGTDATGAKVTAKSQLINAGVPLGIETGLNAKADKNPKNPNAVITMLLDDIGLSASVNNPESNGNKTTLDTDTSNSMVQFKKSVGQKKFDQLGQQYDQQYQSWLGKAKSDPRYTSMSPTEQADQVKGEKSHLSKTLLKPAGYKVVKGKKTSLLNYGH